MISQLITNSNNTNLNIYFLFLGLDQVSDKLKII